MTKTKKEGAAQHTLRLRPGVTTVTRAPLQSHDLVLNVRISIFEYICLLKSGDFGNFRKLENFEWEEIKIFRKAERPSLLFSSRALILSHVSPEPDLFLVWRHVQPDVQTKRKKYSKSSASRLSGRTSGNSSPRLCSSAETSSHSSRAAPARPLCSSHPFFFSA